MRPASTLARFSRSSTKPSFHRRFLDEVNLAGLFGRQGPASHSSRKRDASIALSMSGIRASCTKEIGSSQFGRFEKLKAFVFEFGIERDDTPIRLGKLRRRRMFCARFSQPPAQSRSCRSCPSSCS